MARKGKKSKRRIFLVAFLCLLINASIFYYVGNILKDVYSKKMEEKNLNKKYQTLLLEGERLRAEALKLQDSGYVAKYARERFLYSKDNEYIVKIKDN